MGLPRGNSKVIAPTAVRGRWSVPSPRPERPVQNASPTLYGDPTTQLPIKVQGAQ